jgi:hypothetical protein
VLHDVQVQGSATEVHMVDSLSQDDVACYGEVSDLALE